MHDSCIELLRLTLLAAQMETIEKETENFAILTRRMTDPQLAEPPMMELERASAKRHRRMRCI